MTAATAQAAPTARRRLRASGVDVTTAVGFRAAAPARAAHRFAADVAGGPKWLTDAYPQASTAAVALDNVPVQLAPLLPGPPPPALLPSPPPPKPPSPPPPRLSVRAAAAACGSVQTWVAVPAHTQDCN